jgi:hypothetical protein
MRRVGNSEPVSKEVVELGKMQRELAFCRKILNARKAKISHWSTILTADTDALEHAHHVLNIIKKTDSAYDQLIDPAVEQIVKTLNMKLEVPK